MHRALLHECAQHTPGSARVTETPTTTHQSDATTNSPESPPHSFPTVTSAAGTTTGDPAAPLAPTSAGMAKAETNTLSQSEAEILLQHAIESKRQLEARIEELRKLTQ